MSLLNKNQLDLLQKLNLDPNSPNLKAQIDTKILELENKIQIWENINWQTSNFKFIQISLKTGTEIAEKYDLKNLKKDLQDEESWLFNHIKMSKDKTCLDFFCLENEKYVGRVQLEKMGEKKYELFVPEDRISNLTDLLQQFSELVFGNLSIKSLHLKQTEEFFEKYKKEIYKAGFEFEKEEKETGCIYSIKTTQNGNERVENQNSENSENSEDLDNFSSQEFCTQLHIAETEKYNHVTYFFNGGQDKKFSGEDWIVIPSNKVASHAEIPEMKAKEVTDKILEVLGRENLTVKNEEGLEKENRFLSVLSREDNINYITLKLKDDLVDIIEKNEQKEIGFLADKLQKQINSETKISIVFDTTLSQYGWKHNLRHHSDISVLEYAKILLWTVFNNEASIFIAKNNPKLHLIVFPLNSEKEDLGLCKYIEENGVFRLVSVWHSPLQYLEKTLHEEDFVEYQEFRQKIISRLGTVNSPIPAISGLPDTFPGVNRETNFDNLSSSQGTADSPIPNLSGMPSGLSGDYEENSTQNSNQTSEVCQESLQIKKAKIEDLGTIIQIQKDCYLAKFGQKSVDVTDWLDRKRDRKEAILSDKTNFLTAVQNGGIVGSAVLIDEGEKLSLEIVFVTPTKQKMGIGTFLIQNLLSQIKIPKDIYLETYDAQEFYQKFGFEDLSNGKMVLRKEKIKLKLNLEFIYKQDKTTQNLEFKNRPTVKAIIYNPKIQKYLWHKNVNNLFIDTNFALIGGGIKQNETVGKALLRKLKTEAGLDENELESINLLGKTEIKYEFVVDEKGHANIVSGNLETDKNFNINELNSIFYIETLSEKTDIEEDSCISKWLSKDEILAGDNNLTSEARFLLENLDKLKAEIKNVKVFEIDLKIENNSKNQNCQIREMDTNDLEEVKEIILEGWQDSVFFEIDPEILRQNCERSSFPVLENPNYHKFVCLQNDQIIGFLTIENKIEKAESWIGDFYIKKEFRKQGVGKFLFSHGLDFIKQNGGKEVFLYLDDANLAATKFYTKVGFVPVKKSEFEWLDKNGKVVATSPEHLMKLKLNSQNNQSESQIQNPKYDYIIVNFANPDMVGHTGDIPASIRSMEFLDEQLGRLLEVIERENHEMIIIADHGNMEFVGEYRENGKILTDTEHNPSPVPCVFVGNKWRVGNPELENNKQKLYQNLENLNTQNITNLDLELVKKILQQKNQVDLTDQENWLKKEQIEDFTKEQLPLWYSGALLLGL